jgi:asparagine synthase (glutamine-hydrolysing)
VLGSERRPQLQDWLASFERDTLRVSGVPQFLERAAAEAGGCRALFDGVLYTRAEWMERFGFSAIASVTDADLLLCAYRHWGERMLGKIRGVFALIVWDADREVLLCARDPLGVYPLFYAETGRQLLLSLSIEALVRHPQVSGAVNRAALADHLCHRWPEQEETFLARVRRVPPGHLMRVRHGDRHVSRYWDPAPPDSPVDWIGEEEVERFDTLLEQAVSRSLDRGPAGIFLSGGLDSVTVAAAAVEEARRQTMPAPRALSIGFPHPECDEEAVQRAVADRLGMPQTFMSFHEAVGPGGLFRAALELSPELSAPLQNPWAPAYHRLGVEGKRHNCEVILTGGGGDEWLCVSPYYAADLLRSLDLAGLYRLWQTTYRSHRASGFTFARSLGWRFGLLPLLRSSARDGLRRASPALYGATRRWRSTRALPPWIAPDDALRRELAVRADRSPPEHESKSFYFRQIRQALEHPMVAMEMEETFERGRRIGIPIRQPFWDAELVDFLYRVPPALLNRGGRSKGLVRDSLARRFPSLGFEQQRKVTSIGFFESVMMREGPDAWASMGGTPALAEVAVVDARSLEVTIAAILGGSHRRDVYCIWDVLALEAWVRPRL